jgi:hypothetical protein
VIDEAIGLLGRLPRLPHPNEIGCQVLDTEIGYVDTGQGDPRCGSAALMFGVDVVDAAFGIRGISEVAVRPRSSLIAVRREDLASI